MFKDIDFTPGKIVYFDFDTDSGESLNKYDEDLLQVKYPKNILLDAGWYTNSFVVYVIKNCNWENPVVKKECKDLAELHKALKECVIKIRKMLTKKA